VLGGRFVEPSPLTWSERACSSRDERYADAFMHALRAVLMGLTCLWICSTTQAEGSPFEQFIGEYRDVSIAQSRQKIDRAITEAIAPMGCLTRAVARKRLQAANPVYPSVRITQRGELLMTSFAGRRYVAAVDGKFHRNTEPDGRIVDVSYAALGNTLRARYVAAEGEMRFDLTVVPGTSTLDVKVTLLSSRIPRPVLYELAYAKVMGSEPDFAARELSAPLLSARR
jgi:hypothetical protein